MSSTDESGFSKGNKRAAWTRDESLCLMRAMIGLKAQQTSNTGGPKLKKALQKQKLADDLKADGFIKTTDQIQRKTENLREELKKMNVKYGMSGSAGPPDDETREYFEFLKRCHGTHITGNSFEADTLQIAPVDETLTDELNPLEETINSESMMFESYSEEATVETEEPFEGASSSSNSTPQTEQKKVTLKKEKVVVRSNRRQQAPLHKFMEDMKDRSKEGLQLLREQIELDKAREERRDRHENTIAETFSKAKDYFDVQMDYVNMKKRRLEQDMEEKERAKRNPDPTDTLDTTKHVQFVPAQQARPIVRAPGPRYVLISKPPQ